VQYFFEDYLLDPERRELTRGVDAIAVGPQVFDLLVHLVRNRAHVVGKDELFDVVWCGRIVSESTLTSHINAARKAVGDSGQAQRLIRTIARKGFRFVGEVREMHSDDDAATPASRIDGAHALSRAALTLPNKPSIAVLPFVNLSGDPQQDYFADGVVEDIIAALSRMRWLFVIARNSSFTYKGGPVDVRQVGRELGVRYVLEGSVRKVARRVRITGQLIDATTGVQIWADRFEGTLGDIFELQDGITENVVGAIAPRLERAEIERAKRKPTESLDGYDYYLRGMANLYRGTRESIGEAMAQFTHALELDPNFASAYAMAAWCCFWRKLNGWMVDRPQELAEGARLARRAVELGDDDAVALTRGGHALGHFTGDFDRSIALIDRALVLDPNLASAWFLGGFSRVWNGEPEGAIEHFTHAMRSSPLDPEMYRMQAGMAAAHLFTGRYETASAWAAKAYRHLPSFSMVVSIFAASHALAGRQDEARRAMDHLRALDPTLRVSHLADWLPIRRPEDLARFADGLRKAGLPE
jgi:TolB-like protein